MAEQHRGEESDSGSSSGDDALHSTYAAMARRLHGGDAGGAGRASKARWAGRLALLAGLRVAAAVLAARR